MAWYLQWSDALKKRACRYLLQRYLQEYLQEKLTLNQLSVDLYEGTGTIADLNLDVEALNDMADTYNLPIEFVDGYIRSISVCIPWSTLLKDSSFVEVQGLMATIQPKQRSGSVSVVNSIWGSMTTSMQLAEECLRQDQADEADRDAEPAKPFEGLERFAQTIESVLCRIKVRFVDTTFRLEHVPKGSSIGVALELRIKKIDFFDEAGSENGGSSRDADHLRNVYEPAAFSCKNFHVEGVTLHTDEFPSKARTFAKSVISMDSSPETKNLETFTTAPDTPEPGALLGQHSVFESCFGSSSAEIPAAASHSTLLNLATESDPILVAKMSGRHEIRLRVKLCESIPGPRVSIDCSFGSVVVFCSPRQVHVLLELFSGLVSPDLEDDSNVCRRYAAANKPMQASDFKKVEQELQKHLTPHAHGRSLHPQQGWSSQSLEDSDDEFHPIDGSGNRMTTSMTTSNASSQISDGDSMSSSSTRCSPGGHSKERVRPSHHGPSLRMLVVDDALAESTYFKTQLSSLVVVVLHDNVLTLAASGHGLVTRSSVVQMKAQSEEFFAKLGVFSLADRDLESAHKKLSTVCQANHLRLIAAPFTLEGTERASSSVSNLICNMSVGTAELTECLFDKKSFPSHPIRPECSTLIGFKAERKDTANGLPSGFPSWSLVEPCIKVRLSHWEHLTDNSTRLRRMTTPPPRTEIHVDMSACHSELDITIVDRISVLLDQKDLCGRPFGENFCTSARQPSTNHGFLTQAMEEEVASGDGRKLDLSVAASKATLYVRFPVPDLRPLHDMDRMPWWKRTIRSDVLTLEVSDARLRALFVTGETSQTYDISCRELHGLFQEKADDPPISFLHASAENCTSGNSRNDGVDEGFDWPRLTLKIFPPSPTLALEEQDSDESDDVMHTSSLETIVHDLCASDGGEPSPFSTRKLIYKSNETVNNEAELGGGGRRRQPENAIDSEQIILPGERSEAAEFIERSAANCQFVVELSSANVNLVLPSKHFYEVLYNRISTDLMLWERAAPRPVAKDPSGFRPPPLNHDWANSYARDTVFETFSMCKSARRDDTSSESDDDRPSYVTYGEHKRRQTRRQRRTTARGRSSAVTLQNRVCFTLTSKQATVTLRAAHKGSADKSISDCHGEMHLQVSDVLVFVVSTAPNSLVDSYMCVHANQAALYHHGFLPSCPADFLCRVGPATPTPPGHLFPTLYLSETGIRTKQTPHSHNSDAPPDMLMVAIRVTLDTVRRVKTFRVAVGVRDATLRHRFTTPSESWYQQFVDFFDVLDYPVVGYQTPAVITELHLHTWGCAVDYRPVNLPLRVVLAVETFSICSNIAAQTSSSVVRVILEDVYLFLSKNLDSDCVDLRKDYVCVVDVGFFELSLRLSDAKDQRLPQVDLRASNNMLHIRTCMDSCRALQELIGYLASDGDLRDGQGFSAANSELSLNESDLGTLTNVEAEQVHNLMAEAMKESGGSSRASSECENTASNSEISATGDVFLFPDEARHPTVVTAASHTGRHSKQDDASQSSPSGDSLDDEFCILENEPGIGILSRSGEPQVRFLASEPISIVDNHFSVPLGRIDQLKAPKHFPTPTLRYTLHEISLVWHLYGGNDFPSVDGHAVTGADELKGHETKIGSRTSSSNSPNFRDARYTGVAFSKTSAEDVHFRTSPTVTATAAGRYSFSSDALMWRTNGGPGRQHDVLVELHLNKVRFRHEKYPESAEQASRQILLIHEVEIRDRLASSQMNKFLYLYSSESMPRQSHANMVVMKALHLRSDPSGASEECALKVSLLPLRFNIDQDALFFLYHFLSGLSSGGRNEMATVDGEPSSASVPVPAAPPSSAPVPIPKVPVMSVAATASSPTLANGETAGACDSQQQPNLLIFEESAGVDHEHDLKVRFSENYDAASMTSSSTGSSSSPLFFRSFVFSPEVPIRLDYHGKRVDMEQGAMAGLLIGLGQLNCSELRLKRLSYRHGLLGVERLLTYALTEWLHDIRQTQLPGVLGGVGPFHSLVQLFQGCRDLFWLPIEQYRKDGRIIRGLQRGANAFTTSTAMAVLELANRLVQAVQCTAETAYDVVSPGPSVRASRAALNHRHAGARRPKRASQPADIREGMANALHVVREGISDTARTIVQVASEEHEQKGISGAVGGVLRQIPPTVVKPIILATEATSNVLGGMRHQLAPDVRREAAEKWRSDDD